ncbi:folate-biopterin transporter 1, chloroplastic-like [Pyrus x bretschneideri]|uniref:folate-biopterin transporter 1, chloroplastic-like n=1 Tax=Pyrus x bretschneideri TaxID=225117 RepID=UPI00202DD557|nr:folate-biopterin transporter 1, chloroplastic-like [Pyrus x bretschneideri]
MSVAVPMASPTRRLNLNDQPFLNSRIRERDVLITDRVKEASMPSPSMTKHRTSSVKVFGIELCPDNVAVAMVFCSRCPRPCKACCQFLTFHLKDDLHLDLAEVHLHNYIHTFCCFSELVCFTFLALVIKSGILDEL